MAVTGQRLIFYPNYKVQVEEHEYPSPGPNQILVRVTRSQVSAGSEMNGLHAMTKSGTGRRPGGYTTVGRVEEVGSGIQDFKPGDRILCFGNHGSHTLETSATNHTGDPIHPKSRMASPTTRPVSPSWVTWHSMASAAAPFKSKNPRPSLVQASLGNSPFSLPACPAPIRLFPLI